VLDPPTGGEAGRRAVASVLAALLPRGEAAMLELAAAGERVLALWTGDI
jgi:hypothetical protein